MLLPAEVRNMRAQQGLVPLPDPMEEGDAVTAILSVQFGSL